MRTAEPVTPTAAAAILEPHHSAAARPEHVAAPIGADAAAHTMRNGPRGALLVAAIAVGLLFMGWMAFYFLLFLPRGPIG
jgi:hypothetical protein